MTGTHFMVRVFFLFSFHFFGAEICNNSFCETRASLFLNGDVLFENDDGDDGGTRNRVNIKKEPTQNGVKEDLALESLFSKEEAAAATAVSSNISSFFWTIYEMQLLLLHSSPPVGALSHCQRRPPTLCLFLFLLFVG